MVARHVDSQQEQPRAEEPEGRPLPEGLGNVDLVQEIMRTFNETNMLRRNRRLIF